MNFFILHRRKVALFWLKTTPWTETTQSGLIKMYRFSVGYQALAHLTRNLNISNQMKSKNIRKWKFMARSQWHYCFLLEHITFLIVFPDLLTLPMSRVGRKSVSRSTKFWEIPGLGGLLNKNKNLKVVIPLPFLFAFLNSLFSQPIPLPFSWSVLWCVQ